MTKITVYRHDPRDFADGDEIRSAGDHRDRLTEDQKSAENAIREGKPNGDKIRADSLYVYHDVEMAETDWKLKPGRHLYELEVDDADIAHSGDLQIYHEVLRVLRKDLPIDDAVKRYWAPVETGRHIERLVSKAIVVRRLKDAKDYKKPGQRAVEKIRDSAENDEFYEMLFEKSSPEESK